MDKTIGKGKSFIETEKDKIFSSNTSASEKLAQAWYITIMTYGIDPNNPPKMDKTIGTSRKHAL